MGTNFPLKNKCFYLAIAIRQDPTRSLYGKIYKAHIRLVPDGALSAIRRMNPEIIFFSFSFICTKRGIILVVC